jgi:predicted DNA-binding transcriptional regulator AlpA
MRANDEKLLTIPAAAKLLKMSRQRMWVLVSEGRIPHRVIGERTLILDGQDVARLGKELRRKH